MLEMELQRSAELSLELYRARYLQRYGSQPLILNIAFAMTLLKDVIRASSPKRVMELIEFYLKSGGENDWYKRQRHDLTTFKNNIEKLHGHLSLMDLKYCPQVGVSRGPKVSLPFHCDNHHCGKAFLLECYGDELNPKQYCQDCKS